MKEQFLPTFFLHLLKDSLFFPIFRRVHTIDIFDDNPIISNDYMVLTYT